MLKLVIFILSFHLVNMNGRSNATNLVQFTLSAYSNIIKNNQFDVICTEF